MYPSYSVTYEIVTPESAASGDFSDAGFEEVDVPIIVDEFDKEGAKEAGSGWGWEGEQLSAVAYLCFRIADDKGLTEWSSSDPSAGDWLSSPDAELNYETGESLTRHIHFAGLTDKQWQQLVRYSKEQWS
tara:strand:+ start:24178 stop:24567 length:390 start_codon:yes stop_codon:yes gene_type:complete